MELTHANKGPHTHTPYIEAKMCGSRLFCMKENKIKYTTIALAENSTHTHTHTTIGNWHMILGLDIDGGVVASVFSLSIEMMRLQDNFKNEPNKCIERMSVPDKIFSVGC